MHEYFKNDQNVSLNTHLLELRKDWFRISSSLPVYANSISDDFSHSLPEEQNRTHL